MTARPGPALPAACQPTCCGPALSGSATGAARALLSALGIAIGIAALVAVLGITRSSQSALLAEIDQLGTNLLTVTNGQTLGGQEAELPGSPPP